MIIRPVSICPDTSHSENNITEFTSGKRSHAEGSDSEEPHAGGPAQKPKGLPEKILLQKETSQKGFVQKASTKKGSIHKGPIQKGSIRKGPFRREADAPAVSGAS